MYSQAKCLSVCEPLNVATSTYPRLYR